MTGRVRVQVTRTIGVTRDISLAHDCQSPIARTLLDL